MIHENYDDGTELPGSILSSISDTSSLILERQAVKPSLYGSPFAYVSCQNKHDFFKGLLPESTGDLFDQVVVEAADLRQRLFDDPSLSNTGDCG